MSHDILLAVTILMLGAATVVWVLRRLRLSPIIGYLLLGMLAGRYSQTLFSNAEGTQTLAELGVVLLMFFIGLEFHLEQIRAMLKVCLGGGALQVVVTSVAAAGIAHAAGSAPLSALVIGVMVAFSSTALGMKVFEDRRESDSHRARVFLAVGLLQDLAAIVVVVLLPLLSSFGDHPPHGSETPLGALSRLGVLFVLLPIVFFAARALLPRIFNQAAQAREPEVFTLISLSASLCVGFAAYVAGASLPLGAFLGGLVLSRTPFTSQIMAELNTVRNLSLGFFFITIGALVDLGYIAGNLPILVGGLVVIIVLKALLGFVSLIAVRTPAAIAAGVALALAQIGEFSFVLGQEAYHAGLLTAGEHQYVLALAVLSLFPAPFLTAASLKFGKWANDALSKALGPRAAEWLNPRFDAPIAPKHAPAETPSTLEAMAKKPKAVVVGYGPVGRTLTRILRDFGVQPTVVDMNIDTVTKLKERGMSAVYGDAGRREILQAAGIEGATYLLVTLPDLTGRIPVVATAKLMNANLKVLVRARYLAERAMLEEAGASNVAYEEAEVAVALAEFLLREIGAREEDIEREAHRIRAEIALRTGFSMVMPSPVRKKPDPK